MNYTFHKAVIGRTISSLYLCSLAGYLPFYVGVNFTCAKDKPISRCLSFLYWLIGPHIVQTRSHAWINRNIWASQGHSWWSKCCFRGKIEIQWSKWKNIIKSEAESAVIARMVEPKHDHKDTFNCTTKSTSVVKHIKERVAYHYETELICFSLNH